MLTDGFVHSLFYIRTTPSYVLLIRDELDTLTTTRPYRRSRIAEITRDHSLLQIISEREAWIIERVETKISLTCNPMEIPLISYLGLSWQKDEHLQVLYHIIRAMSCIYIIPISSAWLNHGWYTSDAYLHRVRSSYLNSYRNLLATPDHTLLQWAPP